MKKLLLSFLLFTGAVSSYAQTATNFNCNDCSGTSHDLFTELDAGKVIVLVWVMPCGACVGPSLTSYNVVQSYQASYPNRVFLYMSDDYANSSCTTINGWAAGNGVPQNASSLRFSNAAINMADYGAAGMPKIVVLGGNSHTVFYNDINGVNTTSLQNAIDAALSSTGINEQNNVFSEFNLYPNPSDKSAEIKLTLTRQSEIKIEMFNLQGKKLQDVYSGKMTAGESKIPVNTSKLSAGTYLIKVSAEGKNKFVNLVVTH